MNSKIALHAMNEQPHHTHASCFNSRYEMSLQGEEKRKLTSRFEIDLLIESLTKYRATVPLTS